VGSIKDIISSTAHRPWDIPAGKWKYYQEWNNALFLHWKVSVKQLEIFVPPHFPIDTFEGDAYISLVIFKMQKIRPRGLPAFSFISDFHEINVRTYVNRDGKPGVYFLSMEGARQLSVFIAKFLSGLPYYSSAIQLNNIDKKRTYLSSNKNKGFQLEAVFIEKDDRTKTALDHWLTERYCLYFDRGKKAYRYDIHHAPWALKEVEMLSLKTNYVFGELSLHDKPQLAQYADGVKVVAWKKVRLK